MRYRDPMGVSRMLPLKLHSRRTRRDSVGFLHSRLAWGGHLRCREVGAEADMPPLALQEWAEVFS